MTVDELKSRAKNVVLDENRPDSFKLDPPVQVVNPRTSTIYHADMVDGPNGLFPHKMHLVEENQWRYVVNYDLVPTAEIA